MRYVVISTYLIPACRETPTWRQAVAGVLQYCGEDKRNSIDASSGGRSFRRPAANFARFEFAKYNNPYKAYGRHKTGSAFRHKMKSPRPYENINNFLYWETYMEGLGLIKLYNLFDSLERSAK